MTAPAPHLASLSPEHRRQLESLASQFGQSWDEKRLAAAMRKLPADSPLRRPALIEMIKIDLERRRRAGQKARVESYLKYFPELGTADDLPVDLLFAEYQARRQSGAEPDLADYARRFPRQAEELRRMVGAKATVASEAAVRTLRPDEAKRPTAGPAAAPTAPAELPEQFGRYRIVKRLGQGGMGSVYLARDSQLDRQVALKVPLFSAADGPEVLERFIREAQAAAAIHHANICPVYDVGRIDGVPYVTMAYIEGRPLSELVQEGKPLPQRPAAALVQKLALALAEAHRHGVVHRDLKPGNVMVNRRQEPVIMDFGLARRINKEDARLTKAGQVLGTPAYMPPEQVAGDLKAMGPACDVYSLGAMLYELLTGRTPFRGPAMAVLGQILTQEPEPPSKLRPGLDPALEAICLRAMAKKPADRFASMEAMAGALGRYLKGRAAPGPRPRRQQALLWGMVGGGAALVLVLAGSVLSVVLRPPPKPEAGSQQASAQAGGTAPSEPAALPPPRADTDGEGKKAAHESAPAPAAPGGAEKKPAPDPAATPPAKQAEPAPPPLPHADRKDDPTVLVPGDPPLTQGTLDRNLDFWEWVLDLNLTDPQRAQWQRGWTDAFRKKNDNAKAQTLSAVRANVQFWDGMAKAGETQRDLLRFQIQAGELAFLRQSPESEHKLLVSLYDESHKPGGERNAVLVAGDPPLTQDMMDLYRTAMDYVLDLRMTGGQRAEYQRLFIEDWKKHDPKEWAKNIESWRKPLSLNAYSRRVWRAGQRSPLLDRLPKSDAGSDQWLLAACEAAHKPGSERNPVLADGDPPLTRDVVDQYCDMVEAVLDFSVSGGLTAVQRQDLEDYLVKDWKGMDQGAKEDFLKGLQKWPSQARLLAQLRAAPAGDQRSQYLLEIHNRELEKFAQAQQLEKQRHETALEIIRNFPTGGTGHYEYNSGTGRYEFKYDP
jgi:predicted Ser/Thr protein kinase